MAKLNYRKVRPQPPQYAWWDLDGCWFCEHSVRGGCRKGSCKVMKTYVATQKEKRKRKEKQSFAHFD